MSASLVGSEMCIRDSPARGAAQEAFHGHGCRCAQGRRRHDAAAAAAALACLLYTSDAADDM
eukprot:5800443-Alexandrium_andersonii.AAC.1